jgi:hypothetical protein
MESVIDFKIDQNCTISITNSEPNRADFKCEGDGFIDIVGRSSQNDIGPTFLIDYIRFAPKKSTLIKITNTRRYRYKFDNDECRKNFSNGGEDIVTSADSYFNVTVIPKTAPSLTSDKATVKQGERVTLLNSGCSPLGGAEIKFVDCSVYNSGSSVYPYAGQPYEVSINKPNQEFVARCVGPSTSSGPCLSNWSSPVRVAMVPTNTNPCNEPVVPEIDQITDIGRKDYHHYNTETVVCNKSDGNPNCTKERVFSLLMSSKTNQGPVAADFFAAGGLGVNGSLMLSELVYSVDNTPIVNCDKVNLPGPLSIAMGAASYSQRLTPGASQLLNFMSHAPGVANPIMMQVDHANYSVTNYTLPGHSLHPGKVIRTVVEECDKIKIVTIGYGNSWMGDNIFGQLAGKTNTFYGKILFESIDRRFKNSFESLPR